MRRAIATATTLSAAALAASGLVLVAGSGSAVAHPSARSRPAAVNPASVARAHPDGSVKPSSRIHFQMVMTLRHAGDSAKLLTHVSTPGSSSYRHFYTATRWEKRFSPTTSQVHQVRLWLRRQHFTVTGTSKDRLTVAAVGTAKQVESAFGTSLGHYREAGRSVRLASRTPSVPASLTSLVSGVMGINQTFARPAGVTPPPSFTNAGPCSDYFGQKKTTENFGHGYPATEPNVVCGYTPPQFRGAYGIPASEAGKGATVAITDAYASSTMAADGATYTRRNDPANPFSQADYTETLSTPFTDEGDCDAPDWTGEEALDVEAVHAMAPQAHIHYYGAKTCEGSALFDTVQNIVDTHAAQVITNSWGDDGGDLLDDAATRTAFDNVLKMAGSTGISVMFSSGDDGDNFDGLGVSTPDYPAGSPFVTSVGGTSLAIGKGTHQTADYGWATGRSFYCSANVVGIQPGCTSSSVGTWSDPSYDGGSGGYTSYEYTQPAYQKGIVPTALAERNSPALEETTKMRVDPDISMDADPGTGLLEGQTQTFPDGTVQYGQFRIGGTSVASPLLAGVVADAVGVAGKGVGFINPAIYGLDKSSPAAIQDILPTPSTFGMVRFDYAADEYGAGTGKVESFREVTYGGDQTYCDGTNNCATRPNTLSTAKGYDSMTGLGSIGHDFVGALAAK